MINNSNIDTSVPHFFDLCEMIRYTKSAWMHLLNHPSMKYEHRENEAMVVEDDTIGLLHNVISAIYRKDSNLHDNISPSNGVIGSRGYQLPCDVVIKDIVSSFTISVKLMSDPKFNSPILKNKHLSKKMKNVSKLLLLQDKTDALNEMTSFLCNLEEELFYHPINFNLNDIDCGFIGKITTSEISIIEL